MANPRAYNYANYFLGILRLRRIARPAPTEPKRASTIVGFSGESPQPLCAWATVVTKARITIRYRYRFMSCLRWQNYNLSIVQDSCGTVRLKGPILSG